jgi:hypothetical protein
MSGEIDIRCTFCKGTVTLTQKDRGLCHSGTCPNCGWVYYASYPNGEMQVNAVHSNGKTAPLREPVKR